MSSDPEVEHRAKQARFEKAEQLYQKVGNVSAIKFSSAFQQRKLRLIEVPTEVLTNVQAGESLSIIGEDTTEVVLCSKDKTYSIKKVETSNSVFLVPPSESTTFDIETLSREFYEAKPTKPRTEMVEKLLEPYIFNGNEDSSTVGRVGKEGVTKDTLRRTVQASEKELNDALFVMGAVEMDGYMRLVTKSALLEAMQALFNTIIENSWSLNGLDSGTLAAALPDVNPAVLQYILTKLGCVSESSIGSSSSSSDGGSSSSSVMWNLKQESVLKYSAHIVFTSQLQNNPTQWPAGDFLLNWQLRSPGIHTATEMKKHTDLLKGIAVLHNKGTTPYYCYFPADELSKEVEQRFKELYARQSKYTIEEFEGYFDGFFGVSGKPGSLVELLLVYTRNIDGFYVAK